MLTEMALEDPSCGGNPVKMTKKNTRALYEACSEAQCRMGNIAHPTVRRPRPRMTRPVITDIAILGAGVVGLAIAERLLAEGREVVLVDPGEPGMGASYGNAGTIADYAVAPVGTPDVLWNLPTLLFDRNSPLAIRRAALPSLAPWLMRFALQSLPRPAARNARAIAALLSGAGPLWGDLADRIGARRSCSRAAACIFTARPPRWPPPRPRWRGGAPWGFRSR
jgi:hypothetical protein